MSLATYSDLQTAVASHMARSDTAFTALVPDLITLAEGRIFNGSDDPEFPSRPLRLRAMENYTNPASFVTAAATATLALPSGYLGMTKNRECYISTTTPISDLQFVTQREINEHYDPSDTGQPQVFSIQGENLLFAPVPDAAYGIVLGYYARFAAISSGSNWLMTNAPGLYLYGALLEANLMIRNYERAALYARMFAGLHGGLVAADDLDRWPGQLVSQPAFDISGVP